MERGLRGLRVVDVSTGIAGGYCARLLADAGADVIKVEPPGGDPWRAWSAGGATVDVDEGGALFRFLHHGMRSLVGSLGDPDVDALIAGADVVLDSFSAEQFDPRPLLAAHPGLVVCSITPYGRTGPYAGRPTTEFIVQAEAGGLLAARIASREAVPSRRPHERVALGHVRERRRRGGGVARGNRPATASTSTSR